MAYKNIEDRRAYKRQYMREHRAWLKTHHLCTVCKQEDARTLIGKPLCFDCFEKKYGHPPRYSVEDKPKVKKHKHEILKSEYYANGLCAKCGDAPYIEGKRTCQSCYEKSCKSAWNGRKAMGIRPIYPPMSNSPESLAAYQYCIDHRQEYIDRWMAEYGGEYEDRASAKK